MQFGHVFVIMLLGRCSGYCRWGMLFWVQYHFNTNDGAVAVDTLWLCCLMQYHLNTSGGAVAVGAVWVWCCGCSTSLIIVVAL